MVSQKQFEELRSKLATYEALQELGQAEMQAEVKLQVGEVTAGLRELYNTASVAVGAVAFRVEEFEKKSAEELEQCRVKGVCCITKT